MNARTIYTVRIPCDLYFSVVSERPLTIEEVQKEASRALANQDPIESTGFSGLDDPRIYVNQRTEGGSVEESVISVEDEWTETP